MTPPLVSVVMAAYNTEKFLPNTLDSILAQTFTDFELIVIDDKSTDKTPEIFSEYAVRDQRIVVLTNEQNSGPSYSRNRGLNTAQGKYIAIQDSDDVAHSERLAKQVAYLEAHPNVGVLGATYCDGDEYGVIIACHPLPQTNISIQWHMLYNFAFGHPILIFRRDLLDLLDNSYYNETLHLAEDYELFDRLLIYTKAANLPDRLLYRTIHSQQTSTAHRTTQKNNALKISHRAINRLMNREDFLTIEETACLRAWYSAQIPETPTATDFELSNKWLQIWYMFTEKYQPTRAEKRYILYRLMRSLWLMVWTRQPGAAKLLFKLLRTAPLQLTRAIIMYFARQIKKTMLSSKQGN